MKLRLAITSVLLTAVSVAWLLPFGFIARFGYCSLIEPNLFILYSEIILFLCLTILGIVNLFWTLNTEK